MPQPKMSLSEFSAMAAEIDNSTLNTEPLFGEQFWKMACMAASARLGILQHRPEDDEALFTLYDLVEMHRFEPPALGDTISPVRDLYLKAVARNKRDHRALLRLAIVTNILEGSKIVDEIDGYPGSDFLKKAWSITQDDSALCVEAAMCIKRKGTHAITPGGALAKLRDAIFSSARKTNRKLALNEVVALLKRAVKLDPNNARAFLKLSVCDADDVERSVHYVDQAIAANPKHLFARVFQKVKKGGSSPPTGGYVLHHQFEAGRVQGEESEFEQVQVAVAV